MSPAGQWPQLRAAIAAGADAVYFGLDHFSARAKVGFQPDELPAVMDELHARGVKGFVTFNTLVFDNELKQAEQAIVAIANSGADAIIVQDIGIAQLAAKIAPELHVHGSTQMSITSAQGAELAKQMGCTRVVLGRELSLKDIEKIRKSTDVELEVFVHGALCVSYSGQCFSSEAWGGRSANRGKCAQACRLSYDLIVDGQHRDLGSDRYLLSPGDLYAIEQIPELVRLGISCVKIEGRYKDENYVALTTTAYRKAIDAAVKQSVNESVTQEKYALEQIYSRGLAPHFMEGVNHQKVVKARAPRHRGLQVATVLKVETGSVIVEIDHEIRPGDGIVFDSAAWRSPDEPEEGGNVYEVFSKDEDLVQLRFGTGEIDYSRIRAGDLVWRTNDPKLLVQLKPLAKAKTVGHTRPVSFEVTAELGKPLQVSATVDGDITVSVKSESMLMPAQKHGIDQARLSDQLGRLGGTAFHLGDLQLKGDPEGTLFLRVSELNELRRQAVEQLISARKQIGRNRTTDPDVVSKWFQARTQNENNKSDSAAGKATDSRLHLLVRTAEQLQAAIQFNPASITLDYLELYGLRPAVEQIRSAGIMPRVASPRILKPAEQNVIRFLLSLECPILVRSGGLLRDLLEMPDTQLPPLIGDFSLNAANVVSANCYLGMGLKSITPTYDLDASQIEQLAQWVDPDRLEVISYSHLPVFHTEHCVFCRFMSDGTDNTNCGHPCEKHRVALRDASGREHPVMADVGCRNTVFGAEAQVSPKSISVWQAVGIADYRLEFVHETPQQVGKISEIFRAALLGDMSCDQVGAALNSESPAGVTEGSLFVPAR